MNIFGWWKNRKVNKIMKTGSKIEELTNLQMDALKKRGELRKAGNPDEAMKYQKIAQDYERQISKLQESN